MDRRGSKYTGNTIPRREGDDNDDKDPQRKKVVRPPSQKTGKTCPKDDKDQTGSSTKETGQSMKKGGTVKKTGVIKAHKGEVVLPLELVKKLQKLMK